MKFLDFLFQINVATVGAASLVKDLFNSKIGKAAGKSLHDILKNNPAKLQSKQVIQEVASLVSKILCQFKKILTL